MAYFVAPEQALDFIHDLLDARRGDLGLKYVAYGDEDMLPRYPAVKVASGLLTKELHRTQGWLNTFHVDLMVYHAKLNVTHAQRSKNDLELATKIRNLLHSDMTLSGGVIQGWITIEQPAQIVRPKGPAIVGTRMVWEGTAVQQFNL